MADLRVTFVWPEAEIPGLEDAFTDGWVSQAVSGVTKRQYAKQKMLSVLNDHAAHFAYRQQVSQISIPSSQAAIE